MAAPEHDSVREGTATTRLRRHTVRTVLVVACLGAGAAVATPVLLRSTVGAVSPQAADVGHMTQATSPNWAGYIGLGSYQAVSTTLVVPTAICSPGENSSSSFWAGIGGFRSATVEQAGVESACQGGRAAYWAWWEANGGAPSSGPLTTVAVRTGDTVTATVVDLGGGRYAMTVTDARSTTSQSATVTTSGADDSSVECVAEDPSGTGGQVPYTNYGTVSYSSCLAGGVPSQLGALVTGGSPIAPGDLVQISGVTGGNGVDAAVSPTSDGTSFTVTREFPPAYSPPLARPVVSVASPPGGGGYWLVDGAGAVSAHGGAQNYGSMAGHPMVAPVVHIASTPTGRGYWLVGADGGVFCFGDARFYGSMGGQHLDAPVTSLAPGPGGRGYRLVASDGGVFAFGTAFHGSMGGQRLDEPVVGIAPDPATGGYWLVASDGGVFAFDAPFLGSTGGSGLGSPVISLDATTSGRGYRLVRVDGGVTRFGDARRTGDPSGSTPTASAVAEAEDPATGGYWLLSATGTVTACDGTWFGNS